jgi:hypothetical protein
MEKVTANNVQQKELKRYFKEIKSLFPVFGKPEKRFFTDFQSEVLSYASSKPELPVAEVVAYFGEPTVIVANYLTETDADVLLKQVKRTKWIRTAVIIIILLALIVSTFCMVLLYRSFIEGRDSYISREVTEIHEYPDNSASKKYS